MDKGKGNWRAEKPLSSIHDFDHAAHLAKTNPMHYFSNNN